MGISGDGSLASDDAVGERWLALLGIPRMPPRVSEIARRAWTVGFLTLVLKLTAERHPEWATVSYDQLRLAPTEGFTALFARLGLPWTEAAQVYLRATDDPNFVVTGANPRYHPNQLSGRYRRQMSEEDVAEARAVLSDFPLGTWGPAAGS